MSAKHLRLRYYTSYEEAILVTLWREKVTEITSYKENLPIFREISFGLQQYGIKLNKQEVRRRLNSYKNKYIIESGRILADKEYISDWRLYPLVECVLNPSEPRPDVHHQRRVLAQAETKIRQEIPDFRPYVLTPMNHLRFNHDPDGCAFIERGDYEDPSANPEPIYSHDTQFKTDEHMDDEHDEWPSRRPPLAPANRSLETFAIDSEASPFTVPNLASTARQRRRRSIMPRTGLITLAHIERLRKENDVLEEQNDCFIADLEMRELQLKVLEQNFKIWIQGQETVLKNLQKTPVP
ncbi:uncharacterized protein Dwil_GK15416 [Drosophila willistoni]|uniref:Myb/SANT-like DNA-binding domain-containing protein n=1 Tax=Drosophila willistoni TaxID=7260 RepID=B4MV21_DROWI|nr:uncharacterized protein LOC6642357 [Drosophila willistoni]EDW76366.1 uncharacterized protein Dwil_GK15416 [Drosophila willistoni]